jgi:hypothetical protein
MPNPTTADHQAAGTFDERVLTAVRILANRYRAPSTALIIAELADPQLPTPRFQAQVRAALQRLHNRERLMCAIHRGSHHWTPTKHSDHHTPTD